MIEEITKKVDALPPLPKTLIELQQFKKENIQEVSKLLSILDKDPLIMATLLKVANSAMFGFRNKVETTKKAVELIGINFSLSIAFGSAIKSSLNTDLSPYGIDADKFLELSSMGSNFLNKWLGSWDVNLQKELLLPVFLQEVGQFIISELAHDMDLKDKFYADISNDPTNIAEYEKKYFGSSASHITALIFKQWKLDDHMVNYIDHIDGLELKKDDALVHSQILQIARILTNPIDPMGEQAVEKVNQLAQGYGLNTRLMNKAIEVMQDRLLDAM